MGITTALRPLIFAVALALPVQALADMARVDRLITATRLDDILTIMSAEGMDYADTLEADLFPGEGGPTWERDVAQIHDPTRAREEMRTAFLERLTDEAVDPVLDFYETPLGQRIVDGEVIAREALLDDEADATARELLQEMIAQDSPRLELLRRFVEANDLIESNVVGGLNSNFAFYRGLEEGGAFPYEITESEMLAEVWEGEAEMRVDTEEWLLSYLGLAYAGLTDAELEQYIEISQTEAGDRFNAALFAAFDVLFNRVSYELGLAAARYVSQEDA